MEDFIVYLVKSGICLGIFLLVYCFFLRRTTFFRFNRFYLLTGLLAAFILPLFHYTYEVQVSLPIPFFEVETIETSEPVETAVTGQSSGIETGILLLVIYALGMVVRLLLHFNAYRKFRRLLREGEQERLNNYCIVDNPAVKSPFSVFNCIFINSSNLSGVEKDSILKHEQTHITQRHWIDLLCSQFAIMLQWFNPLMWLYIRCQKENHEFLADEAVLEQGVSPALYQAVLINQKFQARVFAFGHPFNYSKPLNRLKMMKKAKTRPWKKSLILILIPAFGAFFHAFAEPRYVVEFTDDYTDSEKVSAAVATPAEQTDDDANVLIVGSDTLKDVLILVNGKEISRSQIRNIHPDSISTIEVLKDSAAIRRSKKGIGLKLDNEASTHFDMWIYRNVSTNNPLIVFDGKEVPYSQRKNIHPDSISSIEVLKDTTAIRMYGEKGKNGVIKITTKKPVENKDSIVVSIKPVEKPKVGVITISKEKNKEITVQTGGGIVSGTFDKDEEPLVIVDGKEISMQGFQALKLDGIESVTILKDSAATNLHKKSVIKITTKNAAKKDSLSEAHKQRMEALMKEKEKEMETRAKLIEAKAKELETLMKAKEEEMEALMKAKEEEMKATLTGAKKEEIKALMKVKEKEMKALLEAKKEEMKALMKAKEEEMKAKEEERKSAEQER